MKVQKLVYFEHDFPNLAEWNNFNKLFHEHIMNAVGSASTTGRWGAICQPRVAREMVRYLKGRDLGKIRKRLGKMT